MCELLKRAVTLAALMFGSLAAVVSYSAVSDAQVVFPPVCSDGTLSKVKNLRITTASGGGEVTSSGGAALNRDTSPYTLYSGASTSVANTVVNLPSASYVKKIVVHSTSTMGSTEPAIEFYRLSTSGTKYTLANLGRLSNGVWQSSVTLNQYISGSYAYTLRATIPPGADVGLHSYRIYYCE